MNNVKNKVTLIGNLGADPEFKEFENGNKLVKFKLATNEYYRNKDGQMVTETHWHNLIAWGKLADIVKQHLTKGVEVAVDGKLTYRSYDDKDGVKRYITEIVVNEFARLQKKSKEKATA